MRLINENGTVNEQLVVLANRYGIPINTETSYSEVNTLFQEKWRQKQLLHAYQITGEPAKGEDLQLLEALGCVNEVLTPSLIEYEEWGPMEFGNVNMQRGNLIMGATRIAVVKRLNFFMHCREGRCLPGLFYLMGGARKLDLVKESEQVLCTPAELLFKKERNKPGQMPATEAEMMQMVWDQSDLPNEWHSLLVNAPMIHVPGSELGTWRPPNTAETVNYWLLQEQKPGYYLVGSSQPYVQYQLLVVERAFEEMVEQRKINFPCYFKGCGPFATRSLPLATFLDTLAKQFYEETFCQKWWKVIVKTWHDDSPLMRCGDIVAQGRTWWGARGKMLDKLRKAEFTHVSPGGYAGPFNTKAEAQVAQV